MPVPDQLETRFDELKNDALSAILDDSVSWADVVDDLTALSLHIDGDYAFNKRVRRFNTLFIVALKEWHAARALASFHTAIQGADILEEARKTLEDAAAADWLPGLETLQKRIEAFTKLREAVSTLEDALDEADGVEAEFKAIRETLGDAIEALKALGGDEDEDASETGAGTAA